MVLLCLKTLLIPKFRRFIRRLKLTPIPRSPNPSVPMHLNPPFSPAAN